ncbi:hypothetical protein ACJ6X8_27930 [Pseudomonas alvandae]|uniref:hypothetical protein n=1 Tax=Pseudomonas TaxID=286 RepID=UPI00389B0712
MPTFTAEDRDTLRARVQAQITDIESAVSLEDVERNKVYAAGYVDALVAAGAIDQAEATEWRRKAEWVEEKAALRLEREG